MTLSRDAAAAAGPVLEAFALPALLLDPDLVVRAANSAHREAFGPYDDLVGRDGPTVLAGLLAGGSPDHATPAALRPAALRQALARVVTGALPHRSRVHHAASGRGWRLADVPVVAGGEVVGVLHQAEEVTELDAAAAEVLQLREALLSRATIDQAKGVLMAQHGGDADRAFQRLTEMSNTSNVRLADVAAALVYQAQRGPGPSR